MKLFLRNALSQHRPFVRQSLSVFAALAINAVLPHSSIAQTASAPPAVVAPTQTEGRIFISDRTPVKMVLQDRLDSGHSKENDEVSFTVAQDVLNENRAVVIAAGTPAYGKVTEARKSGGFGRSGKLKFSCDYILSPDGTHIPLRSEQLGETGASSQTASVAVAILVSPVALLMQGKSVTIPKGTEFPMFVAAPVSVLSPYANELHRRPDGSFERIIPLPAAPVATPAPVVAAPKAAQSLFLLNPKGELVGTLIQFDGKVYTIETNAGRKTLKASEVRSIYPLAK